MAGRASVDNVSGLCRDRDPAHSTALDHGACWTGQLGQAPTLLLTCSVYLERRHEGVLHRLSRRCRRGLVGQAGVIVAPVRSGSSLATLSMSALRSRARRPTCPSVWPLPRVLPSNRPRASSPQSWYRCRGGVRASAQYLQRHECRRASDRRAGPCREFGGGRSCRPRLTPTSVRQVAPRRV